MTEPSSTRFYNVNMLSDCFLLVLSSPSGAGKTTLAQRLREHVPELRFSVSHTTRAPRAGEVHGHDDYFVERSDFESMSAQGAFVEWAEVHGHLYGTSVSEVERVQRKEGCKGLLFDLDCQGARQIRAQFPEVISSQVTEQRRAH